MNLLQVRTKFRELSGRFDLVNEDYSDSGADFFINEGRKFLDRLGEHQKSWASTFKVISPGKWAVTIPHCRAIKEVWAATTTAKWQLTKKNIQDLLAGYYTGFPRSRSAGPPLYYSPCISRYSPLDASVDEFDAIVGYIDIPASNAHGSNAILLNVPTDTQLTLIINGLFYSAELVNNTDVNYWSEMHPLLLISAAMRQVEVTNRNTQGVNDWTATIVEEMRQIEFDLVDEVIAEVSQMEG